MSSLLVDLKQISNEGHTFRDIVTRQSFLNTIAVINVIGGSTNAVCHPPSRLFASADDYIGPASSCYGEGS